MWKWRRPSCPPSHSLSLSIYFSWAQTSVSCAVARTCCQARAAEFNWHSALEQNCSLFLSLSFYVWELAVRLWAVATRESAMQILYLLSIITENCLHVPNVVEWEGRGGLERGRCNVPRQLLSDGSCISVCWCVCAINKCMQLHLPESALPLSLSLYFFCVIVWGTLRHMPLSPPGSYLFSTFNISNNYKISYNL